jgi:TonB family protein
MNGILRRGAELISTALFMVVLAPGAESPDPPKDLDNQVLIISTHAIREAAVFKQEPEYPAAARQFHVGGTVVAEFIVGVDGKVENVEITKGSPILRDPVIKALRKWSFSPFKVDGRPRRVKSTLAFDFQL